MALYHPLPDQLRICHVIEATAGGSARIAADLAAGQIAGGHDVTLIYSNHRADQRFLDEIQAQPKLRKVELHMRREVGFHDVVSLVKLAWIMHTTEAFHVIHSHCSKAGALARAVGLTLPRTVKVHCPHKFQSMVPGTSSVYAAMERILGVFCDALILVSLEEKRHALAVLRLPESKLHVIHNGVDVHFKSDREAALRTLSFPPGSFIAGFIGRLADNKNPVRLIEAFCLATAEHPHIHLAIVGHGPLKPAMVEVLQKHSVEDRVRFLENHDGRHFAPAFDCLVSSSLTEGFALVLVEALCCGVPIVATPVGGSETLVREGETGYVAHDSSARALADGIIRISKFTPSERARVTEACIATAAPFSLENMLASVLQLYNKLLRDKM